MSPTRWLLFIAILPIFPVGEMSASQKVDFRLNTSRANEMVAQTAISSNDGIFTTALVPADDRKKHFAFGFVEFDLFGKSFHFEAAASEKGPDYVWLLMRDATSGKSTYGGGRFMMAPFLDANTVDVDFNTFYQPPCAFCEFTTCPMPPRGNVLPFPIEAGEYFP